MVRKAAALGLSMMIGVACTPDASGLGGDGGTATPLDPTSTTTGSPADAATGSTGPVAPDDTGTTAADGPPMTGEATTADDPDTSSTSASADTGDTDAPLPEVELCNQDDVSIPDAQPGGAFSAIEVGPLGGGTIVSLSVVVQATHTWVGDLTFDVLKDGTELTIIDRPGDATCSGDDIDVLLHDDAAEAIEGHCLNDGEGTPALGGELRPDNPLDPAFAGLPMAGTWRLRVTDGDPMASGTLDAWCLRIAYR